MVKLIIHCVNMCMFSSVQLALERPTNTARLLSLVGPSSIVINQCYTQFQKNVEIFKKLLKGEHL